MTRTVNSVFILLLMQLLKTVSSNVLLRFKPFYSLNNLSCGVSWVSILCKVTSVHVNVLSRFSDPIHNL